MSQPIAVARTSTPARELGIRALGNRDEGQAYTILVGENLASDGERSGGDRRSTLRTARALATREGGSRLEPDSGPRAAFSVSPSPRALRYPH
jgi:hypothetical protein